MEAEVGYPGPASVVGLPVAGLELVDLVAGQALVPIAELLQLFPERVPLMASQVLAVALAV